MVQQHDPREDQDEDDEEEQGRERDLVEAYVAEHSLEASLNDVINQVVATRPEDPFLMLSSLLYARATAKRGVLFVQVCEVLDASGGPTVLVRLHTGKGIFEGCCSAEAGGITDRESKRQEEDSDGTTDVSPSTLRYGGRGFEKIAAAAQEILTEKLVNTEPTDQHALDTILQNLDTTLGRNVCLATSFAVCQAGAKYAEVPLRDYVAKLQELPLENQCVPMPLFSVVNGGKYASNKLFAQEVLMTPTSAASFADALQIAVEFNSALRTQLEARGVGFTNRGAFGGFAPQVQSLEEVLHIVRAAADDVRAQLEAPEGQVISTASASPLRVDFGVDFAASEFVVSPDSDTVQNEDDNETPRSFPYNTDRWVPGSSGALKNSDELLDIVRSSVKELGITTVVDPLDAGDVKSFAALNSSENELDGRSVLAFGEPAEGGATDAKEGAGLGGDPNCRVQVVCRAAVERHGLTVLSEERACNTVLLVPHQFPTVSRLLQAITDAQHLGLAVILGASAGQPGADADIFAALAMGSGVGQVKFGGLLGAESLDRYRKLLLASQEPGAPSFVGASAYRR
ncbi:enolase-like protein, putative [Phytophthora infestans T30-4]|uniref:phosphopyruvate hydratase n=1 Tax=Phytophthora infestans (strain T30-4) TaxID=403677 RepID=D0NSS0_PHYIT|nr:enolase-like protein, putative [Phytophthora infestans T30-4]EEY64632.1 enolase-like protein, putative [Phytophthora infestans T30-4]|eukprot:XP_002897832.1 enolase-like protein, putative [Phytophthora infestans T30-4]